MTQRTRADQLVAEGRKRGNPVTDPGTEPLPPPVALAVVISSGLVLAGHRVDGVPPWTFPGGEIGFGESPAATAIRRTQAETGLKVVTHGVIGARLHPRTGRHIVYLRAAVLEGAPRLADPEQIDDLRWFPPAELADLMPDMYPPVRELLAQL